MPILLVDPHRRVVAAVHAGWRGALAHIIENAVHDMWREFCSRLEDLIAVIGPSIRKCCYEIQQDVVVAFGSAFGARGSGAALEQFFCRVPHASPLPNADSRIPDSPLAAPASCALRSRESVHLDLTAVARYQLLHAGLAASCVHVADFCTACRTDLFFSHRKEGERLGRMMAVVGIRQALSPFNS
jgi:YfiH family protein